MALNTATKATIAFKNLLNKSNTDADNKGVNNEAEGIFFNIDSKTIFVDDITSDVSLAVSLGIAIQVTADLVLDSTSNLHAFFANWPSTPPTGTDPTTSNPYEYGLGLLANISVGDRIKNSISPAYGINYECKPKRTGATIPPGDPSNWIYQYQSGVFFRQDNIGSLPTTLDLYVYTGKYLNDILISNNSYSAIITGDGTTTDFVINHNLNSIDYLFGIYDMSNNEDIITGAYRESDNLTIKFSKPPINSQEFKVIFKL